METMTHTPLNVDLKKMDYETFKTFMRELAQMYSNVKDDAYLLFYHNLPDLAKEVSTLPRNPLIFYGAYEIANNQVVIISSFAEDKIYYVARLKLDLIFCGCQFRIFPKWYFCQSCYHIIHAIYLSERKGSCVLN